MQAVASGYEGLLGGSDLEGEVGHFCSTWGYGIGKLHDHMGKVVQRLDFAHRTYSKSESEIAQAASAARSQAAANERSAHRSAGQGPASRRPDRGRIAGHSVPPRGHEAETAIHGLHGAHNSADWTGHAADKFRQQLGKLPGDLQKVAQSYGDAATALNAYATQLGPLKSQFQALVPQIQHAQTTVTTAQGNVNTAKGSLTTAQNAKGAKPTDSAVTSAKTAVQHRQRRAEPRTGRSQRPGRPRQSHPGRVRHAARPGPQRRLQGGRHGAA